MCPLPTPPMAGLHGIRPILLGSRVMRRVFDPSFAAACAASMPAWPPPTTITSKSYGLWFILILVSFGDIYIKRGAFLKRTSLLILAYFIMFFYARLLFVVNNSYGVLNQ